MKQESPPMYYVVEECNCPACDGTRIVIHPKWQVFWEQHTRGKRAEIFKEQYVSDWFKKFDIHEVPEEEIACPTCNGKGKVRTEVDFRIALMAAHNHPMPDPPAWQKPAAKRGAK